LIAAAGIGTLGLLAAAASPAVLARAEGGLWEISRSGTPPVKLCVANPVVLAQFEHRSGNCAREVVRDSGNSAVISYQCSAGDFGRSEVTALTPRSLRVETQGISANAPFKYKFQARRVGNC
jgi:hypothetical protein